MDPTPSSRPALARRISPVPEPEPVTDLVNDLAPSLGRVLLRWHGQPKAKPGGPLCQYFNDQFDTYFTMDESAIAAQRIDTCWAGPETIDFIGCGGYSMVAWCEHWINVRIDGVLCSLASLPENKNPLTGRSYADFWRWQKSILIEALEMNAAGLFKHNIVCLSWMRGESKSWVAVLILLWRLTAMPRQKLFFAASTLAQTSFVHSEVAKSIIRDCRLINIVKERNLKGDEIALTKESGETVSYVKTISSGQGIFSNLDAFSVSEVFQSRPPFTFLGQLIGSGRNVPNFFAVVESVIGDRANIINTWLDKHRKGTMPGLYMSYRCSPFADQKDFKHPNMSDQALAALREATPFAFEQHFQNLPDHASSGFVPSVVISAMDCVKIDGKRDDHALMVTLKKIEEINLQILDLQQNGKESFDQVAEVESLESRITHLTDIIGMSRPGEVPGPDTILKLEDLFDTHFATVAGIDLADPQFNTAGEEKLSTSRSILSLVLKGNIGSRSASYDSPIHKSPQWIYIIIGVFVTNKNSTDETKALLSTINETIGLDKVGMEKHASADIASFCKAEGIPHLVINPTAKYVLDIMSTVHGLLHGQRIKAPRFMQLGSLGNDDLLREEISYFAATQTDKGNYEFHSKEKKSKKKNAVQDDAIFATAAAIFAARDISADSLDGIKPYMANGAAGLMFGGMYDRNGRVTSGRQSPYDVDGFVDPWPRPSGLLGDYD